MSNNDIQQGIIISKLERIESDIVEINNKLEKKYVTADEFNPVRNVVYGMVALILSAVVVALITLIIKK